MDEFLPFFTCDGSPGLYSKRDNDIYHSVYGALTEAYNKFIIPANFDEYFENKKEIKILDLCYGIGYNTKSFLNNFFQKKDSFTEYTDTIYTDNNLIKKCITSIHTDKILKTNRHKFNKIKNFKVQIDAIDTNKKLIKLSPFFKVRSGIKISKNTGINKIDKYLANAEFYESKYKLLDEVNLLILIALCKSFKEDLLSDDVCSILDDKKYEKFFEQKLKRFAQYYLSRAYDLSSRDILLGFLHNIYYGYISKSYKNTLKVLENNNFIIRFITDDARKFLVKEDIEYDFIFLDAFTPSIAPSLWTYDFFKLLYSHLDANGKILTYSNSAAVRNAMIKNNFYISKIFNPDENKYTGTIASKNYHLLENNLNDFDIGLLKTTAGIMYRDENLSSSNSDIINLRNYEISTSNLISSTKYIKNFKGDKYEI